MAPSGLTSGIVDSFVKTSPDVLFLAFGRRAILTSATMWQALLYPPIFVRLIDMSLSFLFGWKTQNITPHQKLAAYPHLYSFTSTKSVVHWFQIIRNGKFQMYDDDLQAPFSISDAARYYKVAKFPTKNIKTPIVLVYGGSDSLVDIEIMLKELPKHAVVKGVPHYEHLDFLWASDVESQVFPHVFNALDTYANPDSPRAKTAPRFQPFGAKHPDTVSPFSEEDDTSSSAPVKHSDNVSGIDRPRSGNLDATASTFKPRPTRVPIPVSSSSPAASASHFTERTSTSRPEGWWSSDEVGGTEPSTPATKTPTHLESPELTTTKSPASSLLGRQLAQPWTSAVEEGALSGILGEATNQKIRRSGSKASFEGFGEKGISVGVSRPVGGVSRDVGSRVVSMEGPGSSTSEGRRRKKKRKD
jgi:lysosomal acid lipase/cholesteryl ester hydrolase